MLFPQAPAYVQRQNRHLGLVFIAILALSCDHKDECVGFGNRFDDLNHEEPDAVLCGISEYFDETRTSEIVACLLEQLQDCSPAFGRFLIRPPQSEADSLYAISVGSDCRATILKAKISDDGAFVEVVCNGIEVPDDMSLVVFDDCAAENYHPSCVTP